ncbi:MAG: hypothetical protein U1E78_09665 [Gammaproteobacteria bacterium]
MGDFNRPLTFKADHLDDPSSREIDWDAMPEVEDLLSTLKLAGSK